MSKATKRKHVTKEVTDDYVLPGNNLEIVKVLVSRGNNLHEVETATGQTFLASMPTKFRKNVWIKRGDFVMVESIAEGDKVKAEISHILYRPQINYITQQGLWPEHFSSKEHLNGKSASETNTIPDDMLPASNSNSDNDDNEEEVVCNPNRRHHQQFNEQRESEEESEEEDESLSQPGTL